MVVLPIANNNGPRLSSDSTLPDGREVIKVRISNNIPYHILKWYNGHWVNMKPIVCDIRSGSYYFGVDLWTLCVPNTQFHFVFVIVITGDLSFLEHARSCTAGSRAAGTLALCPLSRGHALEAVSLSGSRILSLVILSSDTDIIMMCTLYYDLRIIVLSLYHKLFCVETKCIRIWEVCSQD